MSRMTPIPLPERLICPAAARAAAAISGLHPLASFDHVDGNVFGISQPDPTA